MKKKDLVSIIVPVYRAEKFIRTCLDSLLDQTYENVEIIAVYSKSPDDTLGVLKEYETKIKLIEEKGKKSNPATARNIGIQHANGKYIAFCDADDFFASEKIEKQIHVLEKFPNMGLVYTDEVIVDCYGDEIKKFKSLEWDRKYWLSYRFITFSSIVLRKYLLDKIGDFDPKLIGAEDFDLLIRLSDITEFKRIPEFLTFYRVHQMNLSKNTNKTNIATAQVFGKNKMHKLYIHQIFWIIPMAYMQSYFFPKAKKLLLLFIKKMK